MTYDGNRLLWENRRICSARTRIGEVIYEPGGSCGPRVQRDWQLVFLHSGQVRVSVDGVERSIAVGHAGLFRPGHREYFEFSKAHETRHTWCAVEPAFMPADWAALLQKAPPVLPCNPTLHRLVQSALAMGYAPSAAAGRTVDCIALAIFAEYLNSASEIALSQASDPAIAKAIRAMLEHLARRDCLHRAHAAADVSRNTLITRFRRELRITPGRYLWKLRVQRGMEMLAETGLTVAEIAYQCGFQNPFHFSRMVKQFQGAAPQEVRRLAWGKTREGE